ncbi:MAG: helix-turn-helix domain-containing protein [Desulfurococcales archaeon]|nr:helix-turn-helix domain-containing protein [Desulfurococcales archaeon]
MESPVFYIAKILEHFGYPPAAARVYAILLYTGQEMSITDLSAAAGIGKSTASTALRLLEHDGLVYHVKLGKKKLYKAKSALNQLLLFPRRILNEYLVPLRTLLEQELANEKSENLENLLRELNKFESLTKKILKIIEENN